MNRLFRYILALTMPLIMASCGEKPVTPVGGDDVLEASFSIKDAPEQPVVFQYGETKTFSIEKDNVFSLSVVSPEGWTASVEDEELVVTAPSDGTSDECDVTGSVTVIYSGKGGDEQTASLDVMLEVTEEKTVTFELVISNITSTSAELSVIPSRDDIRYYYDVCTKEDYDALGGDVGKIIEQYVENIQTHYPSMSMSEILDIMLSQGPGSDTVINLPAGTVMCFYAVAVNDEGKPYGKAAVVDFTTEKGGNPADCTFDLAVSEIKGTTVYIDIQPSDPSVRYFYGVASRADFPGDIPFMAEVKAEAESYALELGMSVEELIEAVTVTGSASEYWYDLEVGTEYYLYAFAMDAQGNSAGKLYKEAFKTSENDISDAEISLSYKYFDGDALYAADPEAFPNAEGRLVMQVYAEPNLYTSDWAVALASGDYTDDYNYPYDLTVNAMLSSGVSQYNKEVSTFYGKWASCTILGFGSDYNGMNGALTRILVEPVKENASPVSDFVREAAAISALSFDAPKTECQKTGLPLASRLKACRLGFRIL